MGKYKHSNSKICQKKINYKKSRKNEWWDKEGRQATKQKNVARMNCLQQKTRANEEHYKEE